MSMFEASYASSSHSGQTTSRRMNIQFLKIALQEAERFQHAHAFIWGCMVVVGRGRMAVGFTTTYAISVTARCTRNDIMWYSLSVACDRSVGFTGSSGFLHQPNMATVSQIVVNRTIYDLSYDHLPTNFATVSQNLSECFFLMIPDLCCEVSSVRRYENR